MLGYAQMSLKITPEFKIGMTIKDAEFYEARYLENNDASDLDRVVGIYENAPAVFSSRIHQKQLVRYKVNQFTLGALSALENLAGKTSVVTALGKDMQAAHSQTVAKPLLDGGNQKDSLDSAVLVFCKLAVDNPLVAALGYVSMVKDEAEGRLRAGVLLNSLVPGHEYKVTNHVVEALKDALTSKLEENQAQRLPLVRIDNGRSSAVSSSSSMFGSTAASSLSSASSSSSNSGEVTERSLRK